MNSIRAVVFDLDDTLYSESDYVLSGFSAVATEIENIYGISGAQSELAALFGADRRGVFGRFLRAHGLGADGEKNLVDVYRNHAPKITLFPSAERTLTVLRERGYKLGVITDGDGERQRNKADALGLLSLVDEFIVTDASAQKPKPDAFINMANALGVSSEQMMYVGDNPLKDFAVKKFIPITTVRVSGGIYSDRAYADGILPDMTVADVSQLSDILGGVRP